MKKFILLIPILYLLILGGCGFQKETNTTNGSFEKKEKCFTYKQTELKKYKYDNMDIFYSTSLDTCVFTYWDYKSSEDGTHYNTIHVIRDLLDDKIIFSQTNASLWQEKINELKK